MPNSWSKPAALIVESGLSALGLPVAGLAGAVVEAGIDHALGRKTQSPNVQNVFDRALRQVEKQLKHFDEFEVSIPPNERRSAIDAAVSMATSQMQLSYAEMAQANFDPARLWLAREPAIWRSLDETLRSEIAVEYAKKLTNLMYRQILAIASSSDPVGRQIEIDTYIAARDTPARIEDLLEQVFVPSVRRGGAREDAEFTARYLEETARKFGHARLFGLDNVPPALQWAPLDVTYVGLSSSRPVAVRNKITDDEVAPELRQIAGQRSPLEESMGRCLQKFDGRGGRLSISGLPGSGKTTVSQWLAIKTAVSIHTPQALPSELSGLRGRVPFLVQLRRLPDDQTYGARHILHTAIENADVPNGWLERLLRASNALIIFDGLDELRDEKQTLAKGWIKDLIELFPENVFVVTARPEAVDRWFLSKLGFWELDLLAMRPDQSVQLISRWFDAQCASAESGTAEAFRQREARLRAGIMSDPALAELCESPLLAAMLCAYFASGHTDDPRDRKALVRGVVAALLHGRDRARGLVPPELVGVSLDHKLSLLGQIALGMLALGVGSCSIPPAPREGSPFVVSVDGTALSLSLGALTPSIGGIADHILERSGLFLRVGLGEAQFAHRMFLEFHAAHRLVQRGGRALAFSFAEQPGWYSVAAFYCFLAPDQETELFISELTDMVARNGVTATSRRRRLAYCLMDCLSQLTDSTEAMNASVSAELQKVLPPHSDEEVVLLASMGSWGLGFLANPTCESDAIAAVATAGRVRTESALDLIAAIAEADFGPQCRNLIIDQWREFANPRYATDVLSRLRLESQVVTVPRASAIADLHLFNPVRVSLGSCDGLVDLTPLDGSEKIKELDLRLAVDLTDLKGLEKLTALRRLALPSRGVEGLESLTELKKLQELHIPNASKVKSLRSLRGLSELKRLSIAYADISLTAELEHLLPELESLVIRSSAVSPKVLEGRTGLVRLVVDTLTDPLRFHLDFDLSAYEKLRYLEVRATGFATLKLPGRLLTATVEIPYLWHDRARVYGLDSQSQLRELRLRGDMMVRPTESLEEAIATAIPWTPELLAASQHLILLEVTDTKSLSSLRGVDRLPRLRVLNASRTPIRALSSVTTVDVGNIVRNEDGEFVPASEASGPELEWDLSPCKSLEQLILDGCGNLVDLNGAHRAPALRRVSLRDVAAAREAIEDLQFARPDVEVVFSEEMFHQASE